jgi:hypothetical protein
MNIRTITFSTLALSLLLSGCVGTGPNTQNGAVAGGAIGALAGAIIGNNSRGGNSVGGALIGGAVGAIAGGTIGNNKDHQEGTLYGNYDEAYNSRVEMRGPPPPPPAPLTEVIPAAPTNGALWIPGYWSFESRGGDTYTWVGGHWEVPPPNVRNFVTAHWERHGHRYVWVQSYWQ